MPAPFHIDCIGDSITSGIQAPSYPRMLRSRFQEEGMDHVQVNNHGKEGFTVGDYLSFQSSEPNRSMLQRREIDLLLILLGTNDTRDTANTPLSRFEHRFKSLLQIYHAQTQEIFILNIPPYYPPIHIDWQGSRHTFDAVERIQHELNPAIETITAENGFRLIDIHTPLSQAGKSAFADGIHPNRSGNKIIADTCYQILHPIVVSSGSHP